MLENTVGTVSSVRIIGTGSAQHRLRRQRSTRFAGIDGNVLAWARVRPGADEADGALALLAPSPRLRSTREPRRNTIPFVHCSVLVRDHGCLLVGTALEERHRVPARPGVVQSCSGRKIRMPRAWISGKNPDIKTIFASYSAELGERTNRDLQRIFQSKRYKRIFPLTRIGGIGTGWQCNNELIEFVERRGSFRNTTVEGQIKGMELHLGVIDDPVKGSAEAGSRVIRDRTWNWFVDDFCTRFAANGALLVIMTRWHVDDLLGRFIERIPGVRVLRFPAICATGELSSRVICVPFLLAAYGAAHRDRRHPPL
jgi:hypothetical protein